VTGICAAGRRHADGYGRSVVRATQNTLRQLRETVRQSNYRTRRVVQQLINRTRSAINLLRNVLVAITPIWTTEYGLRSVVTVVE